MTRAEDPLTRAERIAAELRAATAEAAGILKDLRSEAKRARSQVDEYLHDQVQAAMNHYAEAVQAGCEQFNRDAHADLQRHMDQAVARAGAAIDAAVGIEQLATAVAREVAAHTVFVDGGPTIVYGPPGSRPGRINGEPV